MMNQATGRWARLTVVLACMAALAACSDNTDDTSNTNNNGPGPVGTNSTSPSPTVSNTGQASGLTVIIGADGIIGAKDLTAKVGERLTIVLQNMSGNAELTVSDPTGKQVGKVEVSGRGQGQTTVQFGSAGAWSYKVQSSMGLQQTHSITVG